MWLGLVETGSRCEGCQWSLIFGLAIGGIIGLILGLVVMRR